MVFGEDKQNWKTISQTHQKKKNPKMNIIRKESYNRKHKNKNDHKRVLQATIWQ